MSQALERIIEEAKALAETERQQLIASLRASNGSANTSTAEEDFEGKLAAEGWLSLPVPLPPDKPPFRLASPLTFRGRALSEVLIEERR